MLEQEMEPTALGYVSERRRRSKAYTHAKTVQTKTSAATTGVP